MAMFLAAFFVVSTSRDLRPVVTAKPARHEKGPARGGVFGVWRRLGPLAAAVL